MAGLIASVIGVGAIAFGAVYPWGYVPLLAAAAAIGATGLCRAGLRRELRPLAAALMLVAVAIGLQVVPMPPGLLAHISPATPELLQSYHLAFAGTGMWAPLSIQPGQTATAAVTLVALSLYVVGLPGLLHSRTLRSLPGMIAIVAIPIALYGIYTREYNNGLIYGFWRPLDGGGGNQFGPFVNRNHFGGWMLMTLGLLIGSLIGHLEGALRGAGSGRRLEWLSSASANRLLGTASVVILGIVAVFWSLSRSSIISLTAMVGVFAWLAARRRRLSGMRRSLAVVSLGAALIAGVAWRGPERVMTWFQDDRNLLSRVEAWRDAWDVMQAFPVFGTGLNTFGDAMLFYQTRNPGFHMAQAHNDYLQLAAEGGLIVVASAAVAILLLVAAIRHNLRMARAESRGYWIRAGAACGLAAIALQELFEFSLQIPANALLFATLAAVALAPVASHSTSAEVSRDTIPLPRRSAGVSLS